MLEFKLIPNTLLVRAKVKIWDLLKQEYKILWKEGYLAPMGITHNGIHFCLLTCVGDNDRCVYVAGDEFAYLTKSYNEDQIMWETVGRCTGLKDKDGTDIFEGDILERKITWSNTTERIIIGYDQASFIFKDAFVKDIGTPIDDNEFGIDTECWTIIGNIHDNPELLKKEK